MPQHEERKFLDGKWLDREECIKQYERLIYKIAVPYERQKNHSGLTMEDLFQVGAIGLLRAYDDYDINRGTKFMTVAHFRIFGAISEAVRDLEGIVRYPAQYHEVLQKINKMNLVDINVEKVAEELGVTENRLEVALSMLKANKHLDEGMDDETEHYFRHGESDDLSWMHLKEYLGVLSERERQIVISKAKGLSNKEIAPEHKITQQMISKILKNAREKYEAFEMGWRGSGAYQKV
ncbi:sigma-70 family RNA polymerase sigma factor [Halobacillus salinus]|uniref:Sigma-70 family RNA polymerase sigma factor n=1 Tax=Halobacillus salinus TaxID=192814 RepID=A0A4Z0H6A2_9BACI|nr:sigma-70 family RNA polymerase sigma factor [Halobacillus salinus]TGB04706.1 sigma-70 family RNA polymerase sigma factor [Halobacillus salinus]